MTPDELIAYASGECRAACKNVWFLFLLDEKITEPCLPDVCTETEFELVSSVLQTRGFSPDLLSKCYETDIYMSPIRYRLIGDDLAALKELHDAIFANLPDSTDLLGMLGLVRLPQDGLWRPTPAYRVRHLQSSAH